MSTQAAYQTLIANKAMEFVEKAYPTIHKFEVTENQRLQIVEGMNPALVGYLFTHPSRSSDTTDSLTFLVSIITDSKIPPDEVIINNLQFELYNYRKRFGLSKK